MTCVSCAVRIERQLNKLEGVSASVNYAIGRASVDFDAESVSPDDLITTIEATGYEASLPTHVARRSLRCLPLVLRERSSATRHRTCHHVAEPMDGEMNLCVVHRK